MAVNAGQAIFARLMDFLPKHQFRKFAARYRGDHRVRSFSCLDQFLCMAFAQLTYRESLRDIETCLRALGPKLYHAGIRGTVRCSTLAHANERRDWPGCVPQHRSFGQGDGIRPRFAAFGRLGVGIHAVKARGGAPAALCRYDPGPALSRAA
jgi:hypothetical protein